MPMDAKIKLKEYSLKGWRTLILGGRLVSEKEVENYQHQYKLLIGNSNELLRL
jgi:hypothetical protein